MSEHPRGILRNKEDATPIEIAEDAYRKEVIRNTQLNSHLHDESTKGDQIRAKLAQAKERRKSGDHPEHLQWDEINLYKTEQEKAATMKIDEPKTPYEGGFNPEGEYYQDDDDEIPDFELGESEIKRDEGVSSLNGGQIVKDESTAAQEEEEEEEEKPLTAEERHRKFEDMRKQHYHMKGAVLGKKLSVSDDEDDA